jgi:hypothetical protein
MLNAMYSLLLLLLLYCSHTSHATSTIRILAVLPSRTSAYLHQVYDGLVFTASRLNLTLRVRDVQGVLDLEEVLYALIEAPAKHQPEIYLIWRLYPCP